MIVKDHDQTLYILLHERHDKRDRYSKCLIITLQSKPTTTYFWLRTDATVKKHVDKYQPVVMYLYDSPKGLLFVRVCQHPVRRLSLSVLLSPSFSSKLTTLTQCHPSVRSLRLEPSHPQTLAWDDGAGPAQSPRVSYPWFREHGFGCGEQQRP